MLDFEKNRLDYGSLLCPPPGYNLDRALATTYSLDLNALLAVPVALFYAQTLEGDLGGERLALLDAVQKLGERVTIFHQASKLLIPAKHNRLFAFLEECLVPVKPRFTRQSFHPKVWVIRYMPERKGDVIRFRLLVLSRNLTFDRSWDVAANLEGEVGEHDRPENAPLADFIAYLIKEGGERVTGTKGFVQQLRKTAFKVPPAFDRLQFHPIGIGKYRTGVPWYDPEHLVIVSPFLDDESLNRFKPISKEAFLFSRLEQLNGVNAGTLSGFDSYHLNQLVIDGERALDSQDDSDSQDLHAKLYVQTLKGESCWLLGSANATAPAKGDCNIEFMLELKGRRAEIQGPRLVDALLGEDRKKGVFVRYERPSPVHTDGAASLKGQLRELENNLVQAGLNGDLSVSAKGANYDLTVTSSLSPSVIGDFTLQVFPFGRESAAQTVAPSTDFSLHFENIALPDLSVFAGVIISHSELLERRRFLLQMEIELPAERLSRIFTLVLQNQDRFFEYLRFLLAESPDKEILLPPSTRSGHGPGDDPAFLTGEAVYEELLMAASRSPKKLAEVERVIKRLESEGGDQKIIPQDFLEVWHHFKGYIDNA